MQTGERQPPKRVELAVETRGSHVRNGDIPGSPVLDAEGRKDLESFCSVLIPEQGIMPAGGDAGVALYVEAVCARSVGLSTLLRSVVATMKGREITAGVAQQVETSDPVAFDALKSLVYEGYYTTSVVLARLETVTGWRAGVALAGSAMDAFDESLLNRVRDLPSIYRHTI
jgi:hypothetical protein